MNYEQDKIGILVGSNCDKIWKEDFDTCCLPNLVNNVKHEETFDDEDDDIFEELVESKRKLIFLGLKKEDVKIPCNKSHRENSSESIIKSQNVEKTNLSSMILKTEEIDIKAEGDTYVLTSNLLPNIELENEKPLKCNIKSNETEDFQTSNYEMIREKPIKSIKKRRKLQLQQNKKCLYKCDYCTFESRHKTSLNVHSLRHKDASEVKMHKCVHCNFQSIYKHNLKVHSLRHIPCDDEKMPECDQTYYQRKQDAHADVFICTKCNYHCASKYSLNQHHLKNHGSQMSNDLVYYLKCPQCDYRTGDRSNLRRHIFRHDKTTNDEYTCDECGLKVSTKYSLKCHILRHKTPKTKRKTNSFKQLNPFPIKQCRHCDFKTKYKKNLLIHELEHENSKKIKVYACEHCEYRTVYKCSIERHTMMKHTRLQTNMMVENITLVKCNKCSFKTPSKSSLEHHKLLHKSCEKVDIYKCSKCEYKTIHKGNLVRHDKFYHASEVEIYQCYECNHKTTRKDELKYHIFRHDKFKNHS